MNEKFETKFVWIWTVEVKAVSEIAYSNQNERNSVTSPFLIQLCATSVAQKIFITLYVKICKYQYYYLRPLDIGLLVVVKCLHFFHSQAFKGIFGMR